MFCDECITQWFERQRTCPVCRSNVFKSVKRTYADGSTSLVVQWF